MRLLEQVRQHVDAVLAELTSNHAEHAQRISATRDPAHGDYQANVVFALAKELNRKPDELASEIAAKLSELPIFANVDVAGKGFINMKLAPAFILESLVNAASDGRCGVAQVESALTYIVDFSSPNVAKPMHVGHIRSTVIGDAITKTLRFMGHVAITDNHLGDWGTQFGMIIYGYKHFVDQAKYDEAPVRELSRLYRLIRQLSGYQAAKSSLASMHDKVQQAESLAANSLATSQSQPKDKSLEKAARSAQKRFESQRDELESSIKKIADFESQPDLITIAAKHPDVDAASLRETALLHEGDATNVALWQQFMPHCLQSLRTIYDPLGIDFDHQLGESFYHDRLEPLVESMKQSGLAKPSEGAVCVFVDGFDAPMIIQKQDGAYLYATTDLATVQYRVETFDPDAILYVVDHRQSEHFAKFFAASKLMGFDVELRHISFGTVMGHDGKPFQTRAGDLVGLETLLDEAISRARAVVCNEERLNKFSLQLDEFEQEVVASTVGIGAIKYADLSHSRTSDYVFDLQKMVQLEGNTAAYSQYSYARTSSILRKLEDERGLAADEIPALDSIAFSHDAERLLAMQLLRFEDSIRASLVDYQPNLLADYLFDTSKQFASFFDQCPVLRADSDEALAMRRLLVNLTRQVLKQGLDLLGIGVVERM
jgi:arginyl-tRNA synthetase